MTVCNEIRFLADMGVSPRCVEWLRNQGFDAVHLYEQQLHKLTDNDVLHKAIEEKRILLTMDLDFARLVSERGAMDLPFVIIFRLTDQRPYNVQAKIEALLPIIRQSIEQGNAIFSVSENSVRVRHIPILRD